MNWVFLIFEKETENFELFCLFFIFDLQKQLFVTIYNNNGLVPFFWGRLWILNRLVRVGHMYSFPAFYSIEVVVYVTSLIDMYCFA